MASFGLQALSQSSGKSSFLALPAHNVSSFNVSAPDIAVECDGRRYGRPIATSCFDAWQLIPSADREISFADRSQEIASDIVLPWRFPSFDGECIIEVEQETLAGRDKAKPLEMKMAAFNIIQKCIKGPRSNHQGGIARHLGTDRNLAVTLKSYEPNVGCIESQIGVLGLLTCQRTLSLLPSSKKTEFFGNDDASGTDVTLPKRFLVDPRRCIISVEISAILQRATWYDVWAAAVAIVGKCVRRGKGGVARGLGTSGKITVRVYSEDSVLMGDVAAG